MAVKTQRKTVQKTGLGLCSSKNRVEQCAQLAGLGSGAGHSVWSPMIADIRIA